MFIINEKLRLLVSGFPFRMPNEIDWQKTKIPVFPFVFSIISGVFFSLPPFLHTKNPDWDLYMLLFSYICTTATGCLILFIVNLLPLGFLYIILQDTARTKRVLYFSIFFQTLLLMFFVIADYFSFPKLFDFLISILILGFVFLRFSSAFMVLKRELGKGKILPLLYSATCLDAWYVLDISWEYWEDLRHWISFCFEYWT